MTDTSFNGLMMICEAIVFAAPSQLRRSVTVSWETFLEGGLLGFLEKQRRSGGKAEEMPSQ